MDVLSSYLDDCRVRGLSRGTIELYRHHLSDFTRAVAFPGDRFTLTSFLTRWENARTRCLVFRTVKSFIRWAARAGLCADYVSDLRLQFPEAAPRPTISPADFNRIMAAVPDTLAGRRDMTLYTVLFLIGARRDAIRLLQWDDVNLADRSIRFVTKARQEQDVPIPPRAARALARWRKQCPSRIHVFPSVKKPDHPIDARMVSRRLPLYARAAGFNRQINVHLLRHSFVTIMADSGVPYETIALATGHRSIKMLERYDRRNPNRLRPALNRVFH